MPTYGYRCQQCAAEFDVLQRMSDPPEASCPTCGGAGKRLFFPAGIVFKGSGFYKTDSRSTASAGNGSAKAADSSTSGAAATGAADGKPAAATAKESGSTTPAAPSTTTAAKPASSSPAPPPSTSP